MHGLERADVAHGRRNPVIKSTKPEARIGRLLQSPLMWECPGSDVGPTVPAGPFSFPSLAESMIKHTRSVAFSPPRAHILVIPTLAGRSANTPGS
ncbi:hypothetical protein DACRYDRAFT_23504 [Dacryopinax primogenitus]|uniref:Uncharacterized protein n=1 Tax=Dacryopinax primogenitus (strain DJM 731) TaxID=1858805 RepID=M5G892_DACPD|nr:uncharacterized protein DACRYDRAFT_23504 [Dacryopinax primogenitus]EJT99972.1 hypothetical protein DACRYDRAFT_23504 [Dacryopinax primogenitus]